MKVSIIPVTPFQQNCWLVVCQTTRTGRDPGGPRREVDRLLDAVPEDGATLAKILVTHGHLYADRVRAADRGRGTTGQIEGPRRRGRLLDRPARTAGPARRVRRTRSPDRWLAGGDTVTVGALRFDVRRCTRATRRGTVVFVQPERRIAFVGDVLLQGSIGRTGPSARRFRRARALDHRTTVAARRRRPVRAGPQQLDVRRRAAQ